MKPIFGITNNSCLLFLLIHTCWLAIIIPARSNYHHHSHHGDDHSQSKSHRSRRISGSSPTTPERWKFMALLKVPKNKQKAYYCSAILINNRSLLTAAHCLEDYNFGLPLEVLFKGKTFRTVDLRKDRGVLHKTKSFKIYDDYWLAPNDFFKQEPYDIAIVKLEKPIVLNPKRSIDRVDLPIDAADGKQYPFDPYNCYLLGYGRETPPYPDHRLQQVKVPVLPRENCKLHCANIEYQICFGYPWKPSKIPPKHCDSGDSGGAFMCKTIHFHTGKHRKLPKYVLIAVNTVEYHGDKNQEKLSIGIRITKYMDWIRQNS